MSKSKRVRSHHKGRKYSKKHVSKKHARKYLSKKHDMEHYNCIHMIEEIYTDHLGIDFSKEYGKLDMNPNEIGRVYGKRFHIKITLDYLKRSLEEHIRIQLKDIQEHDIIIFMDRKERLAHFGLYIGNYQYIHLPIDGMVTIDEFNQEVMDKIYKIYRHKDVV